MSSIFREGLLQGKRILVTGGGTGLGREMTAEYLRLGAELFICGRRGSVLDATAQELMAEHGGTVRSYPVDIRDAPSVDAMVEAIWEEGGPLTGIVNNAAGNFISPTHRLSPRGFDAIANIVLHGSFYVTHAVGRRWIAEGLPGNVISILTTWVWQGSPYVVPSAMSKAGLLIMTKSLAAEWGRFGIRVNAIAPGAFPTKGATERLRPGLTEGSAEDDPPADSDRALQSIPMRRVGEMSELRTLAAFLMADGCDYLTGECIVIDGGAHLVGGGQFSHLDRVTDEEWDRLREAIRAADARDRTERNA